MSIVEEIKHKGFKKYVAAVLFGIIILVFVFFGFSTKSQMGIGYAARVNDQLISVREYREAIEQMINFYSQMFGGQFDAEAQKQFHIRSAALDQLIARAAVVQSAGRSGVQVPVDEIRDLILSVPVFQQNGQFHREFYDNFLSGRRISAAQFEEDLRRDLLAGKVRELFQNGLMPTQLEVSRLSELSQKKMNLEFMRINTSAVEKTTAVSEADVRAFLVKPEGEKRARDLFELNKASYAKDEQVKARHILIKFDAAKAGDDKVALEKINKVKALLKTKNFETVAKEMSEDLANKDKGGDLGFFGRNRMVKEFEDVAFVLEPGKVSEPVKTRFGYHLIKVEAKQPKTEANFDLAKIEIAKKLIAQDKSELVMKSLGETLGKGNMAEVNKITGSMGAKWEETGEFSLADPSVPKIGDSDVVLKSISNLTSESPLLKQILTVGADKFIIKLKSKTQSKEDTAKPETKTAETKVKETRERIAMSRMRDAFKQWNESILKTAKVEKNAALLQGEGE